MSDRKPEKRAVLAVSAMMAVTVISKLLGMVRQMLFAARFADSMEATAFTAAFSVPLALFDILIGAAIGGSFIPVFMEAKKESKTRSVRFASSFLFTVFLLTSLLASLGIAFSRQLVFLVAPALSEETAALCARLLSIMMSAVIFSGIVFTFTGLYQSLERFLLPASVSSLSNLLLIVYLAFFIKEISEKSVTALAWVYLISWALQALVLVLPSVFGHFFPVSVPTFDNPDLKSALSRAPLILLGSWLLPCSSLVSTHFASYLSDASIPAYQYAYNLFVIVVGVLTYGVCNFIFPKLSSFCESDGSSFRDYIGKAFWKTEGVMLLFAAAFGVLARPVTELLYMRGNFTPALAAETASLIPFFALSMPFFAGSEIFIRVFLSKKKPGAVAVSSLAGVLCLTAFDFILFRFAGKDLRWLALSFLLGEILFFLLLLIQACRKGFFAFCRPRSFLLLPSAVFSGAAMLFTRCLLQKKWAFESFFAKIILLGLVFLIGVVVYLGCIGVLRLHRSEKQ